MSLSTTAVTHLMGLIKRAYPGGDEDLMTAVLRLAAKWRSQMIANTIVARDGVMVQHGIFAGMTYLDAAAEGALAARLLGSYESELHPYILAWKNQGLDQVVDIGCAEGYYAVGMARLISEVAVHAYDIDPVARDKCAALAALNGVSDRVSIGAEFSGEAFERFVDTRTLFIVDIEGAERELLDPGRWPALKRLDLLVETHPGVVEGLTGEIARRFAPTHAITRVDQGPKTTPSPAWMTGLGHLDMLLALWEWRGRPTPWLVMRPRPGGPA